MSEGSRPGRGRRAGARGVCIWVWVRGAFSSSPFFIRRCANNKRQRGPPGPPAVPPLTAGPVLPRAQGGVGFWGGCFWAFCQLPSALGCGQGYVPRDGNRLGFVPVSSPGSPRCCGGRRPGRERAERAEEASACGSGRVALCLRCPRLWGCATATSELVEGEARTGLLWALYIVTGFIHCRSPAVL